MNRGQSFLDRRVALLTQHGKERLLAPVLEPALGCRIELVRGFDTDQFGSFTGEVPRAGSQIEAARAKARKGMELSGASIGLASEGSFGPDPITGLLPWDVEVLIWIDEAQGIEVLGLAQGPAQSAHIQTSSWSELQSFAQRIGFPQQQVVLRPDRPGAAPTVKDLHDWDALEAAFHQSFRISETAQVFVEADLRAFANPSRQGVICEAARDLLDRLRSHCPVCDSAGFSIHRSEAGLPCSACESPTGLILRDLRRCPSCRHEVAKTRYGQADPGDCPACNP